jgi:hypothetical protein
MTLAVPELICPTRGAAIEGIATTKALKAIVKL